MHLSPGAIIYCFLKGCIRLALLSPASLCVVNFLLGLPPLGSQRQGCPSTHPVPTSHPLSLSLSTPQHACPTPHSMARCPPGGHSLPSLTSMCRIRGNITTRILLHQPGRGSLSRHRIPVHFFLLSTSLAVAPSLNTGYLSTSSSSPPALEFREGSSSGVFTVVSQIAQHNAWHRVDTQGKHACKHPTGDSVYLRWESENIRPIGQMGIPRLRVTAELCVLRRVQLGLEAGSWHS